jgi:SAM-dependent methyltransferase
MSYTNGGTAKLVANGRNLSERRIHTYSERQSGLLKELACDTINCAMAHWYLLPGLELQRYRLRLAFSLIGAPVSARRELAHLPATMYLDGDFALKSLRAQPQLRSYLDVSSPWLFPFYVLTSFKPERAVLLDTESRTRILFKHLSSRTEYSGSDSWLSNQLGHLSRLRESFDAITCLARLSPEENERELLSGMWNALNPGGVLILSVLCNGNEGDGEEDLNQAADRNSHLMPPSYNSNQLKDSLLSLLGEPRGYAIYGEDGLAKPPSSSWRESLAVGKYWRRYSSTSQLRGRGILVLKFIKSADDSSGGSARSASASHVLSHN